MLIVLYRCTVKVRFDLKTALRVFVFSAINTYYPLLGLKLSQSQNDEHLRQFETYKKTHYLKKLFLN